MWLPHWCMLGMTILLLMTEVAVSRVCTSLITLVDGFHTLFMLMLMAIPLPQSGISSVSLSKTPTPSILSEKSSIKDSTSQQSTISEQSPSAASQFNHLCPSETPPSAKPTCGLSFSHRRIHTVGLFISALLLTSLCASYLMEIASFCLDPHPVRYPLVLVLLGAAALLQKMLMFGLKRDWLQDGWARAGEQVEAVPVWPEEKSISGKDKQHIRQLKACSPPKSSLHTEAIVFCNLGATNVPDVHIQSSQQLPGIQLQIQEEEPKECEDGSHLKTTRVEVQDAPELSSVWGSDPMKRLVKADQKTVCLQSLVFIIQGLFTSLLALINSGVMLLVAPHFPHSLDARSPLIYLDPALSLLAVITLIATTFPQVYSYSLLLLQATPPHICVSDLGRRIGSVPGVQAVHHLHIWQLTKSVVVASVHVHCYAGFPVQRCADVTSGVTKVLQSVGVACCTVQPEFLTSSESVAVSQGESTTVICREDPSPTPALVCSLACPKACAKSMCCSQPEDPIQCTLAPPAGESKEEPHTLVIENTFL